jgi:predicted kinase
MLATRRGVVLDATYRESGERRRLIELAAEENVPVRFLECRASKGEVLRRLAARNERSGEASDADSSIYLRQREEARAFEDIPDDVRVAVDTEKPVDALAADLEALV